MSRVAVIALAVFSLISSSANAQHSVLAEFYGRGVHAYYSGDLITAYDYLTKAIEGGIKDPRAYYFRGLTSVASGREYEAEADYKAGADIEAKGTFGPSVGTSLARIQGSHRLAIEKVRQQARLDYQSTAAARSKARYEDLEAAGGAAPRASAAAPARTPAPPVAPPAAVADTPFADEPAGEPKVDSADALEGADATDPFADDASPAAAPGAPAADAPAAGGDPFGAPAEEPAPAAGDDPFGGDPFGN
jgi:hypothetical protein